MEKKIMTEKPMSKNNQQLQQPHYDGETSLVELATVFVKRRRVFYGVFGLIVALGIVYTLAFAPNLREYTTIVRLAQEDNDSLSPPQEVMSFINNSWYPVFLSDYQQEKGTRLPFKLVVSNPEETSLIRLASKSPDEHAEDAKALHQFIFDQLSAHQAERQESRKAELQERLAAYRQRIEELQARKFTPEAEAKAVEAVSELNDQIGDIQYSLGSQKPAEVSLFAHQSAEKKGLSKVVILAMVIVFAVIFGVFSTFLAEFGAKVRAALTLKAG